MEEEKEAGIRTPRAFCLTEADKGEIVEYLKEHGWTAEKIEKILNQRVFLTEEEASRDKTEYWEWIGVEDEGIMELSNEGKTPEEIAVILRGHTAVSFEDDVETVKLIISNM